MINLFSMKKQGFSLAEVLITLGAIGIVAVLTIPSLIVHINTTKFRTQYKKTLSILNQAALNSENNYDLNFASMNSHCWDGKDKPSVNGSMCAIINGSISGASFYTDTEVVTLGGRGEYSPQGPGIVTSPKRYYLFADGSLVGFDYDIASCTLMPGEDLADLNPRCYGFIDVNGTTAPNKAVQCSNPTLTKISNEIGNCSVRNNSVDMGDIFPVVFHDSTVEPLTNAARFALYQSILNTKD